MFRSQKGVVGKVLGGWQVNGFLTFQSGAPFGVLNGSDPGGVVLGNLVGTSIRPFVNTNLDLSNMSVREIQAAGGRLVYAGHGEEPDRQRGTQHPARERRDQPAGFRVPEERADP